MKNSRKMVLGITILAAMLLKAQNSGMDNMLKVGVNAGIAVPSTNASANLGADLAYQNLKTPGFGWGFATGYNHFFGAKNNVNNVTIKNNDFGLVPVAALLRYYPEQMGFYLGTDLGYSFIVGNQYVAENVNVKRPDGGFYLRPELGWHNADWNAALQYVKVFTGTKGDIPGQDYNAGALGVHFSYNIPLGK